MDEHLMNSQVVDSVNESQMHTLGNSPVVASGFLDTVMTQTTGGMMNQAVANQQNARISGVASFTLACRNILQATPVTVSEPAQISRPVSPLDTPVDRQYREARSALENMRMAMRDSERESASARRHLRDLADLVKREISNGVGPH